MIVSLGADFQRSSSMRKETKARVTVRFVEREMKLIRSQALNFILLVKLRHQHHWLFSLIIDSSVFHLQRWFSPAFTELHLQMRSNSLAISLLDNEFKAIACLVFCSITKRQLIVSACDASVLLSAYRHHRFLISQFLIYLSFVIQIVFVFDETMKMVFFIIRSEVTHQTKKCRFWTPLSAC